MTKLFRNFYGIYTLLFLGLGLLYPVNVLLGFYESKFVKYSIFYFSIACVFILLLLSKNIRKSDLIFASKITAPISIFLVADLLFYRSFVDPYDAIRGFAIVASWWLISVALSAVYRKHRGTPSEKLKFLLRPYFITCSLMAFFALVGIAVIFIVGINHVDFQISYRFGYEFYGRMERNIENEYNGYSEFFSPYGLTLFSISPRVFSFSGLPVVINGWAYEPHLFAFFFAPSIFIARAYLTGKKLLFYYFTAFILLVGAASATFFIALVVVLGTVFLNRLIIESSSAIKIFSKFMLIILFVGTILFTIEPAIVYLLIEKLSSLLDQKLINPTGVSRDSSLLYWSTLFEPKSFFGSGLLYVPDIDQIRGVDFGILGLLGMLCIFGSMFFICSKLIFKSSENAKLLFPVILYLIIHSMKFPLMFYTYPYWSFLFILGAIIVLKKERGSKC